MAKRAPTGGRDGARPRSTRRRRAEPTERVVEGLGVAPGIAIGRAYLHGAAPAQIPEYTIDPDGIPAELRRFEEAVAQSLRQLEKLKAKTAALPPDVAEEVSVLLEAQGLMLQGSRLVRGVNQRIAHDRINAEAATAAETAVVAEGFAAIEDAYLAARAQEVREVGARVIRNLTATPFQSFTSLPAGSIVIAEEVTPADTALMNPDIVAGFAAVVGGAESHAAIMARAMGLPAVLGATRLLQTIRDGDFVIVDGSAGRVIANPTPQTIDAYERRQVELARVERQLARISRLPAVTKDGVAITLDANIELPRELETVRAVGADGIGLLRSEFLFMNRNDIPSEEEQFQALAAIVTGMANRPVTVRTLDIGGDKLASALGDRIAPSANPALGLRAIRLSLQQPDLLEPQLAAILRAGALGRVRLLLPMIETVDEVKEVREILARVARRLVRKGVAIADPFPPVGAMIEVPGAALSADALARVCDFFAIGTNDLTMYTLAIDRGDEQVAHLYNPLHPAVLRLIQFTTEAALRNRIPISICGEIAGDPRFTALLIGLGIRDLSMSAINLPRVKERVRAIDLSAAAVRARQIMDQSDSARISALLDGFNAEL
ncbi:MAG: phosphoenolpyruvate--protein phosphotransferase [Alphaproteobacteria bacterium]|nr:phosphoenolpyruvate--protein phosphotransferase [Alphaproteobacteria bacterium]